MKCNTCNTEYTPMIDMEDTEQAAGCAATLYLYEGTYYILGHYGSRFDMQRYAMKRGHYETGHVCDECINKFIDDGKATLVEDGVW